MPDRITASQFLDLMAYLSPEELANIKGIGPVLSANFIEFVGSRRFADIKTKFQELENKGQGVFVEISGVQAQDSTDLTLSGISIVITGSFDTPRETIKAEIERLGGKVVGSVTKKTNYVLAGQNPGSKLDKARELGVLVMNSLEEMVDFNSKLKKVNKAGLGFSL